MRLQTAVLPVVVGVLGAAWLVGIRDAQATCSSVAKDRGQFVVDVTQLEADGPSRSIDPAEAGWNEAFEQDASDFDGDEVLLDAGVDGPLRLQRVEATP